MMKNSCLVMRRTTASEWGWPDWTCTTPRPPPPPPRTPGPLPWPHSSAHLLDIHSVPVPDKKRHSVFYNVYSKWILFPSKSQLCHCLFCMVQFGENALLLYDLFTLCQAWLLTYILYLAASFGTMSPDLRYNINTFVNKKNRTKCYNPIIERVS